MQSVTPILDAWAQTAQQQTVSRGFNGDEILIWTWSLWDIRDPGEATLRDLLQDAQL